MTNADFDPLMTVGDDDILYMSVGLIDLQEPQPGMVEYPVLFCPFCGRQLQTDEEIDAKAGAPPQS